SDPRYGMPQVQPQQTDGCPDFEDLSRYVDGELDDDRSAHVRLHSLECARCTGLVSMIGTWFDTAAAPSDTGFGGSTCASMESLVGYLTAGLSATESQSVDTHVRTCDECIRTLTLLQSRLAWSAEMDVAVPAVVLARVAEGLRTSNAAVGY